MARLLKHPRAADTKLTCGGSNNTEIPVHGSIIVARSNVLADMIVPVDDTTTPINQQDQDSDNKDDKQNERVKNV